MLFHSSSSATCGASSWLGLVSSSQIIIIDFHDFRPDSQAIARQQSSSGHALLLMPSVINGGDIGPCHVHCSVQLQWWAVWWWRVSIEDWNVHVWQIFWWIWGKWFYEPHLWAASVLPSKWMKRKLPASQTDPFRKRRNKTWWGLCGEVFVDERVVAEGWRLLCE